MSSMNLFHFWELSSIEVYHLCSKYLLRLRINSCEKWWMRSLSLSELLNIISRIVKSKESAIDWWERVGVYDWKFGCRSRRHRWLWSELSLRDFRSFTLKWVRDDAVPVSSDMLFLDSFLWSPSHWSFVLQTFDVYIIDISHEISIGWRRAS